MTTIFWCRVCEEQFIRMDVGVDCRRGLSCSNTGQHDTSGGCFEEFWSLSVTSDIIIGASSIEKTSKVQNFQQVP
jgi:hypothetical protein